MTVRNAIEKAGRSVLGALSPKTDGNMDILDILQAEHDEVQELLERLGDSDSAREQKQLVARIKRALVPHSRAEEKIVYDAVLSLRGKDAKIDGNEGYIEHSLADQTLKSLDKLPANSAEFNAAAKVLKELIDHHIQEEERNIWAQVRENFSTDQRVQMHRAFVAAKKKVKQS